jgi:two-component system response regulator BaeR
MTPQTAGARPFVVRAAEVGVIVPTQLTAGRLTVDLDGYEALLDGQPLGLTALQVELLALFLAAPGKVWSREQLTWICWREQSAGRRVDVQLSRIRTHVGMALFRNVRDRGWALHTV